MRISLFIYTFANIIFHLITMINMTGTTTYNPTRLIAKICLFFAIASLSYTTSAKCTEAGPLGINDGINKEFKKAKEQTYAALCENPLPALQYFMEHFLPGFELTLDEIN